MRQSPSTELTEALYQRRKNTLLPNNVNIITREFFKRVNFDNFNFLARQFQQQ